MGESPDGVRQTGESGEAGPEEANGGAAGGSGSSTVQLRVRRVDNTTTALRLPKDSATTTLRVPDALPDAPGTADEDAEPDVAAAQAAPADAIADVGPATGGAEAAEAAEDEEPEQPVADRPAGVDPRLAMRDSREAAGAALKAGEKPAAADAPAEVPEDPDEPVADGRDGTGSQALKDSGAAEPDADPAPARDADPDAGEAPEEGTVPEPLPEPAPRPEPSPIPEPVPEPGPAPEPQPGPSPKPTPEPTPSPVPGPLPVPDPAPVPSPPPLPTDAAAASGARVSTTPLDPANTFEAMEVLAALNARPVSPFRRAVKRVTIWTVFLALVLGVVSVVQLLRPLPSAKAKLGLPASYTFGGDALTLPWPAKGQAAAEVVGVGSLNGSGPETPVPIASVTKVMNAYLILQAHPLKKGESGPTLTVDKQAAQESNSADESKVTLTEGQQLSEYEALEMLLLPSANNVARLLARWDSGSEDAFVRKMNEQATKLGMGNTAYADPAGYSNDTKSTAKDQLKLAEQVMKDEVFRQIVAEPDTKFNNQKVFNTNALLNAHTGVIGVKTGSSTPAQSCLMWAAVKEIGGVQRMILGVTLGQPTTKEEPSLVKAAQPVSQRIITAVQNGLTGQTLAKQGEVVGYVDNGLGGRVPVVATRDLTVAGWSGITAHLTLNAAELGHNAKAGTQVGTIAAGDGEGRAEVPVALQSDLAPPSILSRLLRIL